MSVKNKDKDNFNFDDLDIEDLSDLKYLLKDMEFRFFIQSLTNLTNQTVHI